MKLILTNYEFELILATLGEYVVQKRNLSEENENMKFNVNQASKLLDNLLFYKKQLKEENNEE